MIYLSIIKCRTRNEFVKQVDLARERYNVENITYQYVSDNADDRYIAFVEFTDNLDDEEFHDQHE